MGFLKRLLGLETIPGEPAPLTDASYDALVPASDLPCFVYVFTLMCSGCQVMGGLLNEIGPDYVGRALFFKLDATKNPRTAAAHGVTGVPTVLCIRGGSVADRLVGLVPLDDLRGWIDRALATGEADGAASR
ncbi:MAG: hypothetical protein JW876_01915 [Candidatus Krumholzibacteriota bacterium]|nr:hypothetical protein [Candidatus Krumholzibacteriota bacterium]